LKDKIKKRQSRQTAVFFMSKRGDMGNFMKKKLITIILALVMMLTVGATLTGCSEWGPDLEFTLQPCGTGYSAHPRVIPPQWFGASARYAAVSRRVTIPSTHNELPVTHVFGFSDQSRLRTITIPESVTHIGHSAFRWTSNLRTVNGAQGVICIGEGAFLNSRITVFCLPPNLESIGAQAFWRTSHRNVAAGDFREIAASGFSEKIIPASVSYIGDAAFGGNNNLTNIKVAENNSQFVSVNGVLYNFDRTRIVAFPAGRTETFYAIPNTVTEISARAFFGSALESVTIPDSVTEIRDRAFYDTPLFRNSPADSFVYADRWLVGINNDLGTIRSSTIDFVIQNDTVGISSNSIVPNPSGHLVIPYSVRHISPAAFINAPQQLLTLVFERPAASGITQFCGYSFSDSLVAGTTELSSARIIYVPCDDSKAEYAALINAVKESFPNFAWLWSHYQHELRVSA